MLADVIRQHLTAPEFHPFTLVLVNGERIDIRQRDSLVFPSTLHRDRRVYAPYVYVVGLEGDTVVTRSISVPLIAQVIDEDRLNGA